MALAVDSEMSGAVGASSSTSPLTYSFTNTAGTVLFVVATAGTTGGAVNIDSVTYAAVSMTKVGEKFYGGGGSNAVHVTIWRLLSPATGANNVVVTTSGAGTLSSIISGGISFTGNHVSAPETNATTNNGSGTTPTVTLVSTVSGNICLSGAACGSAFSADGQTLSWAKNINNAFPGNNGRSQRAAGSGANVVMSHTTASDAWGIVALEVVVAAAAGGNPWYAYAQQ